jgi:hypothetical protein
MVQRGFAYRLEGSAVGATDVGLLTQALGVEPGEGQVFITIFRAQPAEALVRIAVDAERIWEIVDPGLLLGWGRSREIAQFVA